MRTFAAETVKSAHDTMNYGTFIKTLEGATLSLPIDHDGHLCYDFDSVNGQVRISTNIFDDRGDQIFFSQDYSSISYAYRIYLQLQKAQSR